MKIIKYLSLVMAVMLAVSCEKNIVEYNTTPIGDVAEFQLHYFAPVPAVAANYINKILIDGQLYANRKAPLQTYNAIPSGSVGKFLTIAPGNVNIKMYTGATDTTLVRTYNQNVTLVKGKQNVFIFDTLQPPIVFDNGFPYVTNTSMNTDSTCWVKFYNFLYETWGTPTTLKLQYRYINPRNTLDTINIGQPVSFGETTGWQAVKVVKSIFNDAGYRRVDFKVKIIDSGGTPRRDLEIRLASGSYGFYADYWNEYIGRRYHHVLSGIRTTSANAAVRTFTAL
jgi:hypothetical protein